MVGEKQLKEWRGTFGDLYIERNQASAQSIRQHIMGWARMLAPTAGRPPRTILEGGCNIGLNLRALRHLTDAELFAIEPNAKARSIVVQDGVLPEDHILDGYLASIPFADRAFDLVFTAGVLIHVPDDALEASYRELHRVSNEYILSVEYFSPKPTSIRYRDHDDLLFKRDYGGIWLDMFPDLELVADGFLWKRTTGWDDQNWWLFRKRG